MLQLKIGIQLASLRLPLKKALHTAAQLGAEAVEFDARGGLKPAELTHTAARQLRKMLEDLNLRVTAVSFQTRRGYDVLDDLDRRIEATRQAMQMAYQIGAPVVINQVGQVPEQPGGPQWDLLVQVLSELGQYGQRTGALLAASTGSEPGPQLARLLEALPPGSLVVNFDPGNLMINGFSPQDAVEALGPHIQHVHVRDAVRDLARRRGLEVPVGRGSVDFPQLLGTLEEHRYRGYLTIARDGAEDPVTDVRQAITYLRNL